jgi:ribonuclease Z
MPFSVTILGSNSAIPAHGRHPSAQLLNAGHRLFLFDCGEGTQMRLAEQALRPGKLEAIFITHLHGDHYFGLVGLLNTFHLLRRERPLALYGPPALEPLLDVQLAHLKGELTYPLTFHATRTDGPVRLFADAALEAWSFPLDHGPAPTTGFLLRERPGGRRVDGDKARAAGVAQTDMARLVQGLDVPGADGRHIPNAALTLPPWRPRSFAYCTDTAYAPGTAAHVAGVDLLYHEATYREAEAALARERHHATAAQAATVAREAGARRLIVGHYSSRYRELDGLLAEARAVFPDTDLALEGENFEVPREPLAEEPGATGAGPSAESQKPAGRISPPA